MHARPGNDESEPGNTIDNHALLLESQVPLFATTLFSTNTSKDRPSLVLKEGGDRDMCFEGGPSQSFNLIPIPNVLHPLSQNMATCLTML